MVGGTYSWSDGNSCQRVEELTLNLQPVLHLQGPSSSVLLAVKPWEQKSLEICLQVKPPAYKLRKWLPRSKGVLQVHF
jgi:hypothetical protein